MPNGWFFDFVFIFNRAVHESNGLCDTPIWVVPLSSPGRGNGWRHDDITDGHDGTATKRRDGTSSEWRDGSSGRRGSAQWGRVIPLHGRHAPGHDGTAASTFSSSGIRSPTCPADALECFPGVCVCVGGASLNSGVKS